MSKNVAVPIPFLQILVAESFEATTLEISAYFVEHFRDSTQVTTRLTNMPLTVLGSISTSTLPLRLC